MCADATRFGNALLSLGLQRADRVLMFLHDTPVYPTAFFGAIRAALVPLLSLPGRTSSASAMRPFDYLRFPIGT